MNAPRVTRIGICATWDLAAWSFWHQPAAIVAATYLEAVQTAGGLAVVLPPQPLRSGDADALLDAVDGLLLIGGSDIQPECYGQAPSTALETTAPVRDRFELALIAAALHRDLPVFGICRGLQILNAATGGTLHQDLEALGHADHRPAPGRLDERSMHPVDVRPGSLLSEATGAGVLSVNSHHHQGVATVGRGGLVVARSIPDGVVEAVEWPGYHYVLGVQWHPEAVHRDATIGALVAAASHQALQRANGLMA